MESNAITVALIHFKCHCFQMPSAGSTAGHTLCKSAQPGLLQWDYRDLNLLQIHSSVLSLHSQQEGGEKSQHCKAQEVFCRSSHQLLSVRAAPLLLPTISHSKNQSQAPCTTSKNPLKEEFDDTAGKSPGWHRPLLVLMHLHSLIISEILLEQPMPKWAFNQAPAPGGSHCTSLCKREWRTVDENGAGEAEVASRILPLRAGCSQCPLYP